MFSYHCQYTYNRTYALFVQQAEHYRIKIDANVGHCHLIFLFIVSRDAFEMLTVSYVRVFCFSLLNEKMVTNQNEI